MRATMKALNNIKFDESAMKENVAYTGECMVYNKSTSINRREEEKHTRVADGAHTH